MTLCATGSSSTTLDEPTLRRSPGCCLARAMRSHSRSQQQECRRRPASSRFQCGQEGHIHDQRVGGQRRIPGVVVGHSRGIQNDLLCVCRSRFPGTP